MSSDVAIDLIKDVNTAFRNNCIKDKKLVKLMDKLNDGTATYKDAYSYATSIGNARAKAFKNQITSNSLPDGKMYYNIASRLLENTLGEDYNLVSEYAQSVQELMNAENGISLKALQADKNKDRIKGFIDRISSEDNYDDIAWILDEPVKVHALSVVDDTVKKNSEFQSRAGLGVKVIRIAEANCCKWCSDLAGTYTYPGVPGEVFARHDNCRCIVEYDGHKLSAYESRNGEHSFRDLNSNKESLNPNKADWMGEAHKESFTMKNSKGDEIKITAKSYRSEEAENIFTQTNTVDAQNMVKFLNEHVNNGQYGDLDRIVVLKKETLKGLSAYEHDSNTLYIAEELSDPAKFSKLVDKEYFAADNINDVIRHELEGHKQHWDAINRYYQDNISRFDNIYAAKNELESELFRYVNQAQSMTPGYIANQVSQNAYDAFYNEKDFKNRLNELIADGNLGKKNLTDEKLSRLIQEVLHYDGKSR